MAFKKGDPKPPGSGLKKGQLIKRTLAEDACHKLGFSPFEALVKLAQQGSENAIVQLCKHIEPPRKPLDVAVDPEANTIEVIIKRYGK